MGFGLWFGSLGLGIGIGVEGFEILLRVWVFGFWDLARGF